MKEIRLLTKEEIDCRVAQVGQDLSWCSCLLYKDARADMRILDEVFGPMNWQRHHELINGNLFCTVSVWDEEKGQWVSKQDVGVESNTEKEKGQASDAFKRACFNIGIGRELYTAPVIFIRLDKNDVNAKNKVKTRFRVQDIGYTGGNITKLVIADDRGNVRFQYGTQAVPSTASPKANDNEGAPKKKKMTKAIETQIGKATTLEERTKIFNNYKELQADATFLGKLTARKHEIMQAS